MKLVVCLLLSIAVGFVAAEVELGRMGTMSPADMGEFGNNIFEWCNLRNATMGFFTGTEADPSIPNSKCVMYFPTVVNQLELVIKELNLTSLIPVNGLKLIDDFYTLINRYSLWQGYCQFGTMFGKLDNTIETFEGLTTAFYRLIMNYATVLVKLGDLTTAFNNQQCFTTFRALGELFKMVFDFRVPEDYV